MNQEIKDIVIVEKPELLFEDLSENKIRMISIEDETYLEQKSIELIEYMRNNHDQKVSDEQKDNMYLDLQKMWNEVSGKNGGRLNDINFFLILHRQEYNYLVTLLRNKMEYDVDTIFFAMELDKMIKTMADDHKFENDITAKPFDMTPVDVHYLYQLLSRHKVKGLSKESYYFAEIIKRIALTSKIFNYYQETYKNIAKAVQLWVASLEEGVSIQEGDKIYQLIWGDTDIKPVFSDKPAEPKKVETEETVEAVEVVTEK
tara:strand:+ start:2831 stop:3607 length:777 start_codon:yes stop_codon:yes gene_type:complete